MVLSSRSFISIFSIFCFSLILSACGGGDDDPDTTPDSFNFTAATDVSLSTVVESNAVTISGIERAVDISVTGGEYAIDGGGFTSGAGTVSNNQSVMLRGTSSSEFATATTVSLTVENLTQSFSITTEARDIEPDAFSFTDVSDVEFSTLTTSNTVTVTGINDPAPISITGGEYSLDGGNFRSDTGTVALSQTVSVRATSAAVVSTGVDVVLTIGGMSDTFTVTTVADTAAPTAEILFPPPSSMTEGDTVTVRGTADDDFSSVSSVVVTSGAGAFTATDTSGDGSFSTWQVTVSLVEGDDTLAVTTIDNALVPNTDTSAASAAIRRDASLGDFPDNNNPFSYPVGFAIDYSRNRAIIGDRGLTTLIAMDLATGARTPFSDNTSVGFITGSAEGLLVDAANDRMWVGDISEDTISEVDLADGTRVVISSNTVPNTENPFISPREMVVDPNDIDRLFVADQGGGIMAVNILTGQRTVFSNDNLDPPVPDDVNGFGAADGIVLDAERDRLLVPNRGMVDAVYAVDVTTGARTILSSNTEPNADPPLFDDPRTIALDSERNRALLNEQDGAMLISVDLDTGARSIFSNATTPDSVNAPLRTEEIFYDGNFAYGFWVDSDLDAILAVDIETGERVFVSKSSPAPPM